jgi:hypothetical protein
MARPRNYVIDRIGELAGAGVEEIVFVHMPTRDVEAFQRVEEEAVVLPRKDQHPARVLSCK